jgi:hypothetical protein
MEGTKEEINQQKGTNKQQQKGKEINKERKYAFMICGKVGRSKENTQQIGRK